MTRFQELMECFLKPFVPGEPHCGIISSDTTWEGEQWTELHENGDTMNLGGMTIPMSTEFLVCENHAPKKLVDPSTLRIAEFHEMEMGECIHPNHPNACKYPER